MVRGGDQSKAKGLWFVGMWEAHKAAGFSLLGLPEASQQWLTERADNAQGKWSKVSKYKDFWRSVWNLSCSIISFNLCPLWNKTSQEVGLLLLGLKSQQFVAERDTTELIKSQYEDTYFQSMV